MRKKSSFNKILIVLYILTFILAILLFINFKTWEYFDKKEIKMIHLIDRCSILFESILHSIKDESSCENYCRSECITRDMQFYNSEFFLKENSCNLCNCYCK